MAHEVASKERNIDFRTESLAREEPVDDAVGDESGNDLQRSLNLSPDGDIASTRCRLFLHLLTRTSTNLPTRVDDAGGLALLADEFASLRGTSRSFGTRSEWLKLEK